MRGDKDERSRARDEIDRWVDERGDEIRDKERKKDDKHKAKDRIRDRRIDKRRRGEIPRKKTEREPETSH